MSTLLTRAPRALMLAVATIFTLSLLAPLAVFANTDLASGDQAVISNPNGSGANLRNDNTVLDDSTITAELPQDTVVTIVDGPYVTDAGVWFWVAVDYPMEGWVEASLLRKIDSQPDVDAIPEIPAEEAVIDVAGLPWLEPIDSAVVVDNNAELPVDGLAVRVTATVDGEILGRVPVGSVLDVTEQRIWTGEQSFVRVNFNGQGGYVNGSYVVLDSEQVAAEPIVEEEVIPTEAAPVVTEEPVVEEHVIPTEVPTEEIPVVTEEPVVEEEIIPTDVPTEAPVVTEVPTEDVPVVEEEIVPTEVPTEDVPVVEEPTEEVVPTEEPVVEEPVVTEAAPVVTEEATDDVAPTEEPVVTEAPVETEVAPEDVPVETEVATEEAPVDDVATEEPAATAEVPVEDVVPTEVVTEEALVEDVPTEEPVVTEEPTAEPTEEPAPAVTTAPAFDADAMIGSATVTGTNDGLRCRVAPDATSATLMVLSEGTKVLVFAEAQNGYLGIDCGGVQGYADVNYLWSGGAVDAEIKNSNTTVVVSGTGSGLNCRSGASLSSGVITVLSDGTTLTTRGAASNGWVPVTCGGAAGFVSTTWVDVKSGSGSGSTGDSGSGSSSSGTATVVNTGGDGLYCRSGAGTSYSVITVLSPNQKVSVRGAAQGSWIPVTCGGSAGFASSQYLSVSAGSPAPDPAPSEPTPSKPAPSTGTVTVANTGGAGLNCRSGAGTSHGVITVLSLGQTVSTRSGSSGGWTAVICGGKNGFVSNDYVTGGGSAPTNPTPSEPTPTDPGNGVTGTATVTGTNGDGLNCRSGAGSSNSVITVLSPNQKVDVRGSASNGWLPITCGGVNGWASTQYLTVGGGGSAAPTPDPTPAPQPSGMQSGDHAQATAAVNLRYSASLGSGVSTVVPNGTVVLVTGTQSNGFYPVDWDGLQGFMSADYVVETNAELSKRGGSAKPSDPPAPTNPGSGSETGNAMVSYAMNYLGYPYVWATHGPSSFDCSGFTYWVVKNVTGKNIGTGTWTQVSAGTPVSRGNLQPGDLVFFQNTYTAGLSHVGLYIGGGQFIHAENETTGVVISSLDSNYYGSRWYGAVRV